ncbi:MAG TPA: type II toxin-antitoxin system VapB family antitoxin [Moheibacter sp.]|nr:type II toxin-antitoxin system VapB family antitoxin [Moheibacter sp.]
MRTTITISEKLMEEAMEISGAKTKNQLIQKALKAYIDSIKRKKLITLKGTFDFDIDLDSLRNRTDVEL